MYHDIRCKSSCLEYVYCRCVYHVLIQSTAIKSSNVYVQYTDLFAWMESCILPRAITTRIIIHIIAMKLHNTWWIYNFGWLHTSLYITMGFGRYRYSNIIEKAERITVGHINTLSIIHTTRWWDGGSIMRNAHNEHQKSILFLKVVVNIYVKIRLGESYMVQVTITMLLVQLHLFACLICDSPRVWYDGDIHYPMMCRSWWDSFVLQRDHSSQPTPPINTRQTEK